jgi:hypothetical protein
MKTTINLASAIALCLLLSCKTDPPKAAAETSSPTTALHTNLEKADWLLGKWGNTSSDGELTESWQKANDSVYNGESYFISGKDTLFSETIVISDVNGKMVYTPTVKGQNDEKPVRFDMTSINDSTIVFGNPAHDYPTKIVYNKISTDSLVAEISGMQKGKPVSEKFKMGRLK